MDEVRSIQPGEKIGVVGLGVSGLSAVKFLLYKGAEVFASDQRELNDITKPELEFLQKNGVHLEFGGHSLGFFKDVERVVVGPGVPLQSSIVSALRKDNIQLVGELGLVQEEIDRPVIAVTGTNGKTTVTELIDCMLKMSGQVTYKGGNIGTPVYDYATKRIDCDTIVLEVSSFQLDLRGLFTPHIGLLLNLSPDHLDRHGSVESYLDAKMKLFTHQGGDDYAIINDDDALCRSRYSSLPQVKLLKFGHQKDCHACIKNDHITLQWQGQQENYPLEGTSLFGGGGPSNAAAAILAARAMGCSQVSIVDALQSFTPLAHRMEFVDEIDGIRFINDSKATNSGAVISGLSKIEGKRAILIAGGRDKGEEYRLLRQAISEKVKSVVLIGEAATKIKEAIEDTAPAELVDTLQNAVLTAKKRAGSGDTVLFSPACASFDMFSSYIQRGNVFKEIVAGLKHQR